MTKVAICFFGVTRSLADTIGSIEQNIIQPSHDIGEVRIFSHFFNQEEIDNPRSGEDKISVKVEDYKLLQSHWVNIQEPDVFIDKNWFNEIKIFGDEYGDEFRSIRNLVHQLHSLQKVSDAALSWGAEIYIFARPDILYHDSFAKVLNRALYSGRDTIYLPNWAHWGPGYNDRFCICVGDEAARAYAGRLSLMHEFCESRGRIHAEKLVLYALKKSRLKIRFFSARGSRFRSNGKMVKENFKDFRFIRLKEYLSGPARIARRIKKNIWNGFY
jgi:hypothetical protein